MENAVIRCRRCGHLGAHIRNGQETLCDSCLFDVRMDEKDEKCGNCGHAKRQHGDRAISICVQRIVIDVEWERTVPCDCQGWKIQE